MRTKTDGRKVRSTRKQETLVNACRTIMCKGDFRPSMVAVCAQAGCATRTGFFQFDSLETLYAAALGDRSVVDTILVRACGSTDPLDWPEAHRVSVTHAIVFGQPMSRLVELCLRSQSAATTTPAATPNAPAHAQAEGEGRQTVRRYANRMSTIARAYVAAAILLLPTSAFSQDGFYIQGRLDGLQRQLADLAARVEQLRAEDQQLQQRLETMRAELEARLERLEKGGASARGKSR